MPIKIISLVEPTKVFLQQINDQFQTEEIILIKRSSIRTSLFSYVRKQSSIDIDAIYFLCSDLEQSSNKTYLLGLCFICPVKNKFLIDLSCKQLKFTWPKLLYSVPLILYSLLLGLLTLIFTYGTVKLLNSRILCTLLKAKPTSKNQRIKKKNKGCIAYFWSEFPDSNFNFKVGGEISHIVGFFSGLKYLGYRNAFMVSVRPIIHKKFKSHNEIIDERGLPLWPGEVRLMAYNWKALWKSRKFIRYQKLSLIYHRASTFSMIGVLISIFYRVPLVVEINSSEAWKSENWGRTRFKKLLNQTEKMCTLYSSKVAVVSNEVRDFFTERGVPDKKIIVNPNGVDPDFFVPNGNVESVLSKYDLSEKVIVGFIGSFNRYHGILTLARSIKLVSEQVRNVHFLLIGDGKMRSDFEDIINLDRVSSYVTLTGKVPHESVPNLLDSCDILVSPHQNMEDGSTFFGSPTKIFEYMAMGKGIVASNVGQLGLILQHEKTALLVEPENPTALAENIIRLTQDPILRHEMGQKAREIVIERYTWKKNAERIIRPVIGT